MLRMFYRVWFKDINHNAIDVAADNKHGAAKIAREKAWREWGFTPDFTLSKLKVKEVVLMWDENTTYDSLIRSIRNLPPEQYMKLLEDIKG